MTVSITVDEVKRMLEKAKGELMVDVPENSPLISHSCDRFKNHGITQMFYRVLIQLTEYETEKISEHIKEVIKNDDC